MDGSDPSAIELFYTEAKHDIVNSRYPCTEQDAFTLAALQAQEEFGNYYGYLLTCGFILKHLFQI
jgi:hypothetical protein